MAETPLAQRWGLKTKIDPEPGMVWVGSGVYDSGVAGSSEQYEKVENLVKLKFNALPKEAQTKLYRQAQAEYGYENVPFINMDSYWVKAVETAQQLQISRGERISPLEASEIKNNELIKLRGQQQGSGGGGGGPTKAVNLTDPDTANILVDQALSTYIGRSANKTEQQVFRKALRQYEMDNPTVTEVQGNVAVKSGGTNASEFAKNFGQQQEGSAEYVAATSLMDTFIDALKAQV